MEMIRRLFLDNSMIKVLALLSVMAVLICLSPLSSAGANANIVISDVRPTELLPGDLKEITLTVQNAGSYDARHITFNFEESEYLSVIGSSSVYISSLGGWSSKEVAITVYVSEMAPRGSYSLPVTCSFDQYYSSGSEGSVTESMPEVSYLIVFEIKQGAILDVSDVDLAELKPGEETELNFTISNIGNSPLQNLMFSWSDAEGTILPVYSDNTKYIDYIGVGESVEVAYTVVADVNADAGLYQLDLRLEYEAGNGGSGVTNTTVGVVVGGDTDFDVTFSGSSSGQTSLSVANTGNNPAYSVTVKIPEQKQFAVQGSSASIVGNLDKGDYTIVSFQLTSTSASFGGPGAADPSRREQLPDGGGDWQQLRDNASQRDAAQNNNLNVLIEYTDATGIRRTVERTVPIQLMAMSSDEAQFNPRMRQQQSIWDNTTLLGALVVLLIGGFIYYKRRKSINAFLTRSSREKKE
jgi:hypothetical protein